MRRGLADARRTIGPHALPRSGVFDEAPGCGHCRCATLSLNGGMYGVELARAVEMIARRHPRWALLSDRQAMRSFGHVRREPGPARVAAGGIAWRKWPPCRGPVCWHRRGRARAFDGRAPRRPTLRMG